MTRNARMMLLALAVVLVTSNAMAQAATDSYTVQPGDTAWELAQTYYDEPAMWKLIVTMNPMLQEPGRVFEKDGKIILILRPGEELSGFGRLNARFDVVPPKAIPIEDLIMPPTVTPAESASSEFPAWMWVVLALIVLAIIALATLSQVLQNRRERQESEARERELRQDPITSGPAFVPGGIPANRPDDLRDFFQQQAIATYAGRNPHVDRSTIRVEQIGPIERVTLSGEGEVGYLGNNDWRPRRLEQPLEGYQARFRFPDRTEQVLQCLQGCMNPIRMGGEVMRGFTTTVREAVVPAPAPVVPGPAPAPHPAFAASATMAEAQREGRNSINVHGEVMTFDRGYQVVVHKDNSITVSGERAEITVKAKRVASKKAAAPKTGTNA